MWWKILPLSSAFMSTSLSPWRWRQHTTLKHCNTPLLHIVKTQQRPSLKQVGAKHFWHVHSLNVHKDMRHHFMIPQYLSHWFSINICVVTDTLDTGWKVLPVAKATVCITASVPCGCGTTNVHEWLPLQFSNQTFPSASTSDRLSFTVSPCTTLLPRQIGHFSLLSRWNAEQLMLQGGSEHSASWGQLLLHRPHYLLGAQRCCMPKFLKQHTGLAIYDRCLETLLFIEPG